MRAEIAVTRDAREPRAASPLQVAKAVASAFFGVRKSGDHHAVKFTPLALIVTAVVGAALFVLAIVTLVKLIAP